MPSNDSKLFFDARASLAVSLVAALGACATATPEDGNGGAGSPDAGGSVPGRADAAPGTPDAAPGLFPDASPADNADAAPPPADASPDCTVQPLALLANGDFDLGPGMWIEESGIDLPLIVNQSEIDGIDADSGSFLVWLGGYSPTDTIGTDLFYQDINVPMDATAISFSGKLWIDTAESNVLAWDTLDLEVVDPANGSVLETVLGWSNMDSQAAWVTFTKTLSGSYQGQTVRLRFKAEVDSSNNTSFLVDSLALDTTSCQ